MDDWYTYPELLAIENAGAQCARSMQKLREHDELNRRASSYVPWDVSASRSPEYPTEGN